MVYSVCLLLVHRVPGSSTINLACLKLFYRSLYIDVECNARFWSCQHFLTSQHQHHQNICAATIRSRLQRRHSFFSYHSILHQSIQFPRFPRWLHNRPSPCSTSMTWTAWSSEILLPLPPLTTKHPMWALSPPLLGPSRSLLRAQAAFATPQDLTWSMARLSLQTMPASGTYLNSLDATFVLEA